MSLCLKLLFISNCTVTRRCFISAQWFVRVICLLNCFIHCSRRYGTKCGGCGQGISPCALVRKAKDKVFHLNCFTCLMCRKQLSTGEELYVLDDNKFICKQDYLNGNKPSVISSHQGKLWFERCKMRTRIFSFLCFTFQQSQYQKNNVMSNNKIS